MPRDASRASRAWPASSSTCRASNASRGGSSFGLDAEGAASLVRAVRRATDLPLIAKLTPAASDPRSVARAVEDAGADAIAAINTLPAFAVGPDRTGPALGSGYGGLSGPALRPIALRVVYEIAQSVDIPVIGIGGITTIDDVLDFLAVGGARRSAWGSRRSRTRCSRCAWPTSSPTPAGRAGSRPSPPSSAPRCPSGRRRRRPAAPSTPADAARPCCGG